MEPEKTPREQVEDLISLLVSDWRPTAVQVLWAIRIALTVAIVLGVLAIIGYSFGISLWDWLRVLAVPITIGAAVPLLNWLQKRRELAVEHQRAQDEALQAYLDQMSQLLTDKNRPLHRAHLHDSLSTVARARTLTVLTRLDEVRKGSVMRFLYESGLITRYRRILDLRQADLSWADLHEVHLSRADLREAAVSWANLYKTDLREADLRGAYLSETELVETDLRGADLSRADLSWANLSGVHVTQDQLDKVKSLEGATMPNGQKYEDWLTDKEGSAEDGKNDVSS